MAKNRTNAMVIGTSGKFADSMVYRLRGGVTFVTKVPVRDPEKLPSKDQIKQKFRFMEAASYAKDVIEDPVLKAAYKAKAKGSQSAYNVAFRDYMVAPVLHEIVVANYTGEIGSSFFLKITDVLQVTDVKIRLEKADGTLIEEGDAVMNPKLKIEWSYTATAVNDDVAETIVKVQMTSTPGNIYQVTRPLILDEEI